MTHRDQYTPGPAGGAQIRKDGETWTLILVRELRHPPEKVWQALTDPVHLREWAPFEAAGNLGTVGTAVKLTTVGAPAPHVTETEVRRADAHPCRCCLQSVQIEEESTYAHSSESTQKYEELKPVFFIDAGSINEPGCKS